MWVKIWLGKCYKYKIHGLSHLVSTLVIKTGSFFGTKPLINWETVLYKREGDHTRTNQISNAESNPFSRQYFIHPRWPPLITAVKVPSSREHPLSCAYFKHSRWTFYICTINRRVRRSTRRRLRRRLPRSRRRNYLRRQWRPEASLSLEISGRGFSAKYFYPMFSKILSVIVGRSFIYIGNQVAVLCRVRFLSLLS